MSLKTDIKNLLLTALAKFSLKSNSGHGRVPFDVLDWYPLEAELLNLCLEHNVITETETLSVIQDRLVTLGRESFAMHTDDGVRAQRTKSPHALAYVLRYGGLNTSDRSRIRFDAAENSVTFFSEVGIEFPSEVMQLLKG